MHSNIVPPKEQPNIASAKHRQTAEEYNKNSRDTEIPIPRSLQGPQRIPLGKISVLLDHDILSSLCFTLLLIIR